MREFPALLSVGAELELYLTIHGLKPASSIGTSSPLYCEQRNVFRVNNDSLNDLRSWMLGFDNVRYEEHEQVSYGNTIETNELVKVIGHIFWVGSNHQNLERLLKARSQKDIIDFGLALGYPFDAVYEFQFRKSSNKEPFIVSLIKAKRRGIELSSWLAYLTHIPAGDIVNGISSFSQEQANQYQAFVRKCNPQLAELVEKDFEARTSAVRWEIDTHNNTITLLFDKERK